MANAAADGTSTMTAKENAVGGDSNTLSGGIVEELAQQAVENSENLNGIPINSKCCWSYGELTFFYHRVLPIKIEEQESALRGASGRTSDGGDDGGSSLDDSSTNSRISGADDIFMIKGEAQTYLANVKALNGIKERIENGGFVCKKSYASFYKDCIL